MCCSEALQVLSTDGKGITMRKAGLRACTQKKAALAKNKLETRLSSGEKKDRKRMAQVVTVYSVNRCQRTAEEIIKLPQQRQDNVVPIRPLIKNKRVWASVKQDAKTVIRDMFEEALKRDPIQQKPWIILVDGHVNQLRIINKILIEKKLKATVILDFIHVLEYLWKAAWCLFDKKDPQVEVWVAEHAIKILKGGSSQVVKGLRCSATKRKMSKKQRKNIDICTKYLHNNRARLRYDIALKEGYPIASGVIEGACRHLINDRLDITGATWSLSGAEAMLKIRAIFSSGDWDAYWQYHKAQSKQRLYDNYAA